MRRKQNKKGDIIMFTTMIIAAALGTGLFMMFTAGDTDF
jgi:hypothetical protein